MSGARAIAANATPPPSDWRRDFDRLRARRDARGRWDNEGRRRLKDATNLATDGAVASACGLPRSTINNYANGVSRPAWDDMLRLELALGIPVSAWLVPTKDPIAKLLGTTLQQREPTEHE